MKNVCFSQSRGFQFQKFSWPVGPNHGGVSGGIGNKNSGIEVVVVQH